MKAHSCSKAVLSLLLCLALAVLAHAQTGGGKTDSTLAAPASWFVVKEVADRVWRIDDHGGDNMYLVAGKEKALLIDAGLGVADLSACVRKITSLPVLVVNTHGHLDHSGSDYQFSQVYAHRADSAMIAAVCTPEAHKRTIGNVRSRGSELDSLLLIDVPTMKMPDLRWVQEGFVFNLGGRKLEVIETPGHTPGSICLLDSDNKLLFTGDNDNSLVWLFLKECLPLEVYVKSLEHLQNRSEEFTTIFPGHGDPLEKDFLSDQIACGKQILSGKCTGEPYKSSHGDAMLCKYKKASIAFNPENLHAKQK